MYLYPSEPYNSGDVFLIYDSFLLRICENFWLVYDIRSRSMTEKHAFAILWQDIWLFEASVIAALKMVARSSSGICSPVYALVDFLFAIASSVFI